MDKYIEYGIKDKLDSIRGLIKKGFSEEELCGELGISIKEYGQFRKKYPEFNDATSKKGNLLDGEILETAFKQSVGYYVEEDKAFKVKTVRDVCGKAEPIEEIEVVKLKKYIPPSSTMNLFMLKNRIGLKIDDNEEEQLIIRAELDDELKEWGK